MDHNPGHPPTVNSKSQMKVYRPKNRSPQTVVKPSPKEGVNLIAVYEAPKTADIADNIPTDKKLKVDDFSQHSTNPNTNTFVRDNMQKIGSSKALLHEICTANHWSPPVFECCKEEGPCHMKMFTFKVTVEVAEYSNWVLECFGSPQPKKKIAAEHAAEGALWYLKNLGYCSRKK